MQEMPHEQKFHNFSTQGLNQKKALLQIFNAWLSYPQNTPNFVHEHHYWLLPSPHTSMQNRTTKAYS